MKYNFENLIQAVLASTNFANIGLSEIDVSMGNLYPGLYGIAGPEQTGVHLALNLLRSNIESPIIYYGYALNMLTVAASAYSQLSSTPLPIIGTHLREVIGKILEKTDESTIKDFYKNVLIVDCFQADLTKPLTVDRIAEDIQAMKKPAQKLPIVIIDDFSLWIAPMQAIAKSPLRWLEALAAFGRTEHVAVVVVMENWPGFTDKLLHGANAAVQIAFEESYEGEALKSDIEGVKKVIATVIKDQGIRTPLLRNVSLTYIPARGLFIEPKL